MRSVLWAVAWLVFVFVIALTTASPLASGGEASHSVPKATCGPNDRTETVQGQTTLAERFGPGVGKAYYCNLELTGQFASEGTAGFMAATDTCVYVTTWPGRGLQHPGVTVLDVSDSRRPKVTAYLTTPAMLNANESLAINPTRNLLLGSRFNENVFDLYDLSADCRHPKIVARGIPVRGMMSHIGHFAPDGQTFYGASCCAGFEPPIATEIPPSALFAIDMTNPARPKGIATWIPFEGKITHAVNVNEDGTRAYASLSDGGLMVFDVRDIKDRRPNAQFRPVGSLLWNDTVGGQIPLPATISGHPYIVLADTVGAAIGVKEVRTREALCTSGTQPGHGFVRIIDISDESAPRVVSKLMLEVSLPGNCSNVKNDPVVAMGYGSVFCDVDDIEDAKLLACGYFEGGLRVFDIRDPVHPTEIAYYKPPAPRDRSLPGSIVHNLWSKSGDPTADPVWYPKFRKGGQEIWFVSSGGFHVVRFTDRLKKSHRNLF